MTLTNITADSTSNLQQIITTSKTGLSLATIVGESVVLNAGQLIGGLTIDNSQLFLANTSSYNGAAGSLSIAPSNSDFGATSPLMKVRNQSEILINTVGSSSQIGFSFNEISNSNVVESGNRKAIIYLNPNALIQNVQLRGIAWLEFSGAPSLLANVSLYDTASGISNYRAGRVDVVGLNLTGTSTGDFGFLGGGNSGYNSFYFWNSIANTASAYAITTTNGNIKDGFTISWKFKDSATAGNVLVIYRDNRGGSQVELGRYTTDANGILAGTYDSKNSVSGGNISRPSIWVQTSQSAFTTGTRSSSYGTANNYAMNAIAAQIEVRSYLHLASSVQGSPTAEIGKINADSSINFYSDFVLIVDSGVTQIVQATAAAVTGIAHTTTSITISISHSIAEIYDSRKAYWRDNGGTPSIRIGNIANFGNINITIATGVSIISSPAKFSGGVQTSGIIALTDARTYNDVPVSVASGGSITASAGGNFNIQGWTGSGTTISSSAPSIFTVDNSQISNFIAGTNVTIQAPVVSITAPNFAQNTRVQVARLEPYSVPSTAITTATSIITILGNRFKSAAPATLIYFQLQAGATIPTTTPQITNNTLYFVQASGVADSLTAGQFKLSLTQSGAAIAFSTQGTGSFTLTGITELDNSLAGVSGYSVAFTEPNNTLLRVSAQFWQNTTGCTATNFYQSNILWNLASGNAIADTVNANSNPDLIHNALVGNATKVFSTNVVLPSDGSIVTGISFNAQGTISLDPRLFASVAGFPTLTPQAAYLYTVYYRSTLAGIRIIGNQFTAQDAANFVFAGLKLDNIADGVRNTPSTPATIAGGYVATADGSNPISITSGAIYINADRRAVPITTAGGTVAPTQQQIRDAATLAASQASAVGSIDYKLDNAGGDFIDL